MYSNSDKADALRDYIFNLLRDARRKETEKLNIENIKLRAALEESADKLTRMKHTRTQFIKSAFRKITQRKKKSTKIIIATNKVIAATQQFLYIIHSRHFDIDGPDTLYKFGRTNNITRRIKDTSYTTAFKYPCRYCAYWNIGTADAAIIEGAILKMFYARYSCKSEMISAPLNDIITIVSEYLRANSIDNIAHEETPI